jgi:hypothetical protein
MIDQKPTAPDTAVRYRCICPNGCETECPAGVERRALQRARREANGGPIRLQRVPGRRKPANAAYVGRPTRFGNPARLVYADHGLIVQWGTEGGAVGTWPADGLDARRHATELYAAWINQPEQEPLRALVRNLLHGRDLTCWCPLDQPCHADVLLELANAPAV